MSFRHNSSNIKKDQGFLLPPGWYKLKIVDAEEKKSSNGNDMIVVKAAPIGDEYPNATIWHYVVFLPEGAKGAGMSLIFREAIGVPFGGDDIVNADDWVGKMFMGYVQQKSYEDKEGRTQTKNSITQVMPVGDSVNAAQSDDVPF